jgi:pimeloyl-ACP methyl ester carboxylesterase
LYCDRAHPSWGAKILTRPPSLSARCGRSATLLRAIACDFGALRWLAQPVTPVRVAAMGLALAVVLLAGCTAPIGADRVTTRQAYDQVVANALRTDKPGADTVAILHRFDLDGLAAARPDEAVRQLHQRALVTGERDVLFALAELSYVAGDHIRRGVKPWDPRDARDYYLGSAVYAWLFLYGEAASAPPGAYERRFREACDFYNYGLGLALTGWRSTNGAVALVNGPRRLPVGEIELRLKASPLAARVNGFEQILVADQYRVRGLSLRNRTAGVGAPLICVDPPDKESGFRPATPATVFLRGPASLAAIAASNSVCALELYSPIDDFMVTIGAAQVPLETDLTTYRAYALNQSAIWALGRLQFLAPAERIRSRLILNQPYDPDRIPVVFVHGTFSSPVTWAEMANTLTADPVFRKRYQIWSFVYGSGNPLVQSIAEFRTALTDEVQRLDPPGTNVALRQMVIVGHSQGGLLTKSTVVDAGDRIWRVFSTNRLEDLKISPADREKLHRALFLTPLPFVKRVVFIATPHRGSYLSSGIARNLAARVVSLPHNMVSRSKDLFQVMAGSAGGNFLEGRMPTSLDGMSPKNPGLLAMAEIPVAPGVKANSIVAIDGDEQPPKGGDGVVKYTSAHVDYAESELIVRSYHTCLDNPATIEELRRILREHLKESAQAAPPAK